MRPNLCHTIRIQITLAIALFVSITALSATMAHAAYAAAPTAPFVLGALDGPQMEQPSDVAVDPSSGEAYVADTGNSAIESYGADGSSLSSFGTTLEASVGLNNPHGVVVDSSGDLYVADSGNNRIVEIDSSGWVYDSWGWGVLDGLSQPEHCSTGYNVSKANPITCRAGIAGSGAGQLSNPTALAIDPANGDFYVADTGNDRIEEFNADGNYLGQFRYGSVFLPTALAFDPSGSDVYVVDANAGRVDEFTASGTYEREFGSGTDVKNGPFGVAVDPSTGNVYVSDNGTARVQEFTAVGGYLGQLGSPGSGLGQLQTPAQLGFSPVSGDVLVADQGNNRVEAFDGTPPVCNEAGATTGFNTSVSFQPDCTDPDQQAQRLQIVSLPAHGSVTVQNGQFIYEPNPGYYGSDSFTFEVAGADTSLPATAAILVHNPPAPTCASQSESIAENATATLGLACTASGAPVAYELISGPAHGSLGTIDPATGTVNYTPSSGYTGLDQIVFDATNASGESSPATISLTVLPPLQSTSGTPSTQASGGSPSPATGVQVPTTSPTTNGSSPRVALRTVTCHSGPGRKLTCLVAFTAGSWIGSGANHLSYTVSRTGHTVLSGKSTTHHGSFSLQFAKGLRPGRYVLSVILNHSHQRILVSRAVTVR